MKLIVEPISDPNWLADTKGSAYPGQFGEQSIVLYQADQPTIGHFADRHGYFGASFHLSMPWIKANFLCGKFRLLFANTMKSGASSHLVAWGDQGIFFCG